MPAYLDLSIFILIVALIFLISLLSISKLFDLYVNFQSLQKVRTVPKRQEIKEEPIYYEIEEVSTLWVP